MTMLLRPAGVAILGLVLAGCGGGGGGDEGAIEDVFREFFQAFENEDAKALAGLLTEDCEDTESRAAEAIDTLRGRFAGDVEFNISGVDVRELTDSTAQAVPEGVAILGGDEAPLGSEGQEYAALVKVNGAWKFADCDFLFGS